MATFRIPIFVDSTLKNALNRPDLAREYEKTPEYIGARTAKDQEHLTVTGGLVVAGLLVGGGAASSFWGAGAAAAPAVAPVAESGLIYPAISEAVITPTTAASAASVASAGSLLEVAGGVGKSVVTSLVTAALKPKGTSVPPANTSLAPNGRMFNAPASDRVKWGNTSSALAAGPDDGAFLKLISVVAGALALAGLAWKVAT